MEDHSEDVESHEEDGGGRLYSYCCFSCFLMLSCRWTRIFFFFRRDEESLSIRISETAATSLIPFFSIGRVMDPYDRAISRGDGWWQSARQQRARQQMENKKWQ